MSQGGYVTLVGFVAQDPRQHQTRDGVWVTDLRVGATPRFQDRVTGQWRDAETSYFDVSCWRRLGDHVRASVRKGDPVMIKGRLRSRRYTDRNGVPRTSVDIMADTVGHDLNRGIANYIRPARQPAVAGDPAAEYIPDLPEDGDMMNDEAIEQFGQALERLGDTELATQALNEDGTADAEVTSVPQAPF
jgi:single stranded DNA-binding protein